MTKSKGLYPQRAFAVHTVDSLLAMTDDIGDCAEWRGRLCNGVPYVAHNKEVVPVRRLLIELAGGSVSNDLQYGCSCLNPLCVIPAHIQPRTMKQHSRVMNKSSDKTSVAFVAKMAAYAREHRAKINIEIAREIRLSEKSGVVLAAEFGISRGTVQKIKRNEAWKETSTPFAGLGAR